jgi:hypothetical protein
MSRVFNSIVKLLKFLTPIWGVFSMTVGLLWLYRGTGNREVWLDSLLLATLPVTFTLLMATIGFNFKKSKSISNDQVG